MEGRIKEKIKNECRVKTKLRNIEQWQRRRYIDECRKDECRDIMEVRLNMIEAKKNFKGRHGEDVLRRACRIKGTPK